MKPLHQILPNLEDAVARRVVDPTIAQLPEGELRALFYQLVEHYRRQLTDPDAMFDAMVGAANDTTDRFRSGQKDGVGIRAQVLSRLLRLVSRSMNAVATPVRMFIQRNGRDQTFSNHPFLRGVELAQSRKQLQGESGVRAIAGRSWWVVTFAGECSTPDARWAIMDHTGSIDAQGVGLETITMDVIDTATLASEINDKIVGTMLTTFAARLTDAASGDLARMTAEDERSRLRLQTALVALRDDDARAR